MARYGSDTLDATLIQTGGQAAAATDRFAGAGQAFEEGILHSEEQARKDAAEQRKVSAEERAAAQEERNKINQMQKERMDELRFENQEIVNQNLRTAQADRTNSYKQNLQTLADKNPELLNGNTVDQIVQSRQDVADGITDEYIAGHINETDAMAMSTTSSNFDANIEGATAAFLEQGANGFDDEESQKLYEIINSGGDQAKPTYERVGKELFAVWKHQDGTVIKRNMKNFDGTGAGFAGKKAKVNPMQRVFEISQTPIGQRLDKAIIEGVGSQQELNALKNIYTRSIAGQISTSEAESVGREILSIAPDPTKDYDGPDDVFQPHEVAELYWDIQVNSGLEGSGQTGLRINTPETTYTHPAGFKTPQQAQYVENIINSPDEITEGDKKVKVDPKTKYAGLLGQPTVYGLNISQTPVWVDTDDFKGWQILVGTGNNQTPIPISGTKEGGPDVNSIRSVFGFTPVQAQSQNQGGGGDDAANWLDNFQGGNNNQNNQPTERLVEPDAPIADKVTKFLNLNIDHSDPRYQSYLDLKSEIETDLGTTIDFTRPGWEQRLKDASEGKTNYTLAVSPEEAPDAAYASNDTIKVTGVRKTLKDKVFKSLQGVPLVRQNLDTIQKIIYDDVKHGPTRSKFMTEIRNAISSGTSDIDAEIDSLLE